MLNLPSNPYLIFPQQHSHFYTNALAWGYLHRLPTGHCPGHLSVMSINKLKLSRWNRSLSFNLLVCVLFPLNCLFALVKLFIRLWNKATLIQQGISPAWPFSLMGLKYCLFHKQRFSKLCMTRPLHPSKAGRLAPYLTFQTAFAHLALDGFSLSFWVIHRLQGQTLFQLLGWCFNTLINIFF